MIRINKYLSMCGVTSRRGAETMILEKRISVNDEIIEKLSTMVDEKTDVVKVDGEVVEPVEHKVYVLLNKPTNVMTTLNDPFKRKTILNFIDDVPVRVYPVGRLDFDTEGLLLLTNDGDLAYRLTHPKYEVRKIYSAQVEGSFTDADSKKIADGIKLEDGATGRAKVDIVKSDKNSSRIRLTLTEGRKREVKQLCAACDHPVMRLRRVEFAGLSLRGLQYGKWRYLKPDEVDRLKKLVALK